MKNFILLLVFSVLVISCTDNGITNPENPQKELLKLPASISKVNEVFIKSKEVDGVNGDTINFEFPYETFSGKTVIISGVLEIPAGAFNYSTTFTLEIDKQEAVIDFSPSPSYFDRPLKLNLMYKGINLENLEKDEVDFFYINEKANKLEEIKSKVKVFEKYKGELGIIEAEIWHFSRFGWYI